MPNSQVLIATVIFCVAVSCVCSKSIQVFNRHNERLKRQIGDLQIAHHQAQIGLKHWPKGCVEIGCGLFDIAASGKRKRSYSNNVEDEFLNNENELRRESNRLVLLQRIADELMRES
uniref:QSGamide neuropeptide n=1 Tax=Platynereis dumerilii TaxID=6359 RepID=V5TCS5_PLADU|nr:QSGamide neuropeptide precursor [Platynereis dumerilii]